MKRHMLIYFFISMEVVIRKGGRLLIKLIKKSSYFKNCLWNGPWTTIRRIPKKPWYLYQFWLLVTGIKVSQNDQPIGYKMPEFKGKKIWNHHIWTIGSSRLPKYSRILNFFLLSSLTCSQIWLIPLVDDHQCGLHTNLNKIK